MWNNEDIPWVKLLLLYPLANFCFDDGLGDQLPEQWCLQIAEANFFHNIKSPRNNVIGVLRDPGQAITKAIAKIMEDQDFPKFFGGKAHGWAKGYELVSQFLRLVLPE